MGRGEKSTKRKTRMKLNLLRLCFVLIRKFSLWMNLRHSNCSGSRWTRGGQLQHGGGGGDVELVQIFV